MPSSFDELVRQMTQGANIPRPAITPLADPSAVETPGQDALFDLAAGNFNETSAANTDPTIQDLRQLSPLDIILKYGSEKGSELINAQAQGSADFYGAKDAQRSSFDTVLDTVRGVGRGAVNMGGGLVALGAGLVSDDAGIAISEGLGDFNEYAREQDSAGLQLNRRATEAQLRTATAVNRQTYERERERDGDFVAGLRRVGRDFISGLETYADNPSVGGDVIAEGVGSLALGGPVIRGAKAAGTALTNMLYKGGVISRAARVAALRKGALPTSALAIGVMEGSGSYVQAAQKVMDLPLAKLEQLPDFQELIQAGYSADEARRELAGSTGLLAAAATIPVASLTGLAVGRFEANPTATKGVRQSVLDVVTQTAEEGLQGANSEFAGNVAMKTMIDGDQDLLDGVGTSAGAGALGGFGSAGVLQAPGMAADAAVAAGKLTARASLRGTKAVAAGAKKAGTPLYNSLKERYDQVVAANEAAGAVGAGAVRSSIQTAKDLFTRTKDAIQSSLAQSGTEEDAASVEQLNTALKSMVFDPAEELDETVPDFVREALGDVDTRFDAIERLTQIVEATEEGSPDQLSAARVLADMHARSVDDIDNNSFDAIDALPEDSDTKTVFAALEQALTKVRDNPTVQRAMTKARAAMSAAIARGMSIPQDIAALQTPAGARAVRDAVAVAEHAPDQADLATNEQILKHASDGTITLTPAQEASLLASSALIRQKQEHLAEIERLGIRKPKDLVSEEVTMVDGNFRLPSLATHTNRVLAAYRSGNKEMAAAHLHDLLLFAQHMQNKVGALNAHFRSGTNDKSNAVSYQALQKNRQWKESSARLWVSTRIGSSINLAQSVAQEAKLVGTVANNLVDIFSDLGLSKVNLESLDTALDKPVREVVRGAREQASQSVGQKPQQGAQTKAAEPAAQNSPEQTEEQEPAEDDGQLELPFDAARAAAEEAAREKAEADLLAAEAERVAAENLAATERGRADALQGDVVGPPEGYTDAQQLAWFKAFTQTQRELSKAPAKEAETVSEVAAPVEEPAAEPEPDADPEPVTSPASEASVAENGAATVEEEDDLRRKFDNLRQSGPEGKKTNWFLETFKFPANLKSWLMDYVASPLSFVMRSLDNGETAGSLVDQGRMTPEVRSAYESYLGQVPTVVAKLNKRMAEFFAKHGEREKFPLYARFSLGRMLNLVTGDGRKYDPVLVESAVLAAMHWLNTADRFRARFDEDDVRSMLDLTRDEAAELLGDNMERLEDEFSRGMTATAAARSLASVITKFWGVEARDGASIAQIEGIPEAMAKEIIESLVELGAIARVEPMVEVFGNANPLEDKRSPAIFIPAPLDPADPIAQYPDLIADISLRERDRELHVGESPSKVATHQLHSRRTELTKQQRAAVRSRQAVPFYLNERMLAFYEALGEEGIALLFGGGDLTDESQFNEAHLQTLKGRNITMRSAFAAVRKMAAQVKSHAAANDKAPSAVEVFFEYTFNSMNRLQMLGANSPQSSKLMREVLLATKATLDLNGAHYDGFMLSLAQHLGVKVHKQSVEASIAEVTDMFGGKLAGSVVSLVDWLSAGGNGALNQETLQTLQSELGGDLNPAAVHALMEYARYLTASAEERGAFDSSIYLEADGVTNGPANALMLFSPGQFTTQWLANAARGGFFPGAPKSMNEHKGGDLYEATTNVLEIAMADLLNELQEAGATGAEQQARNLLTVMDLLLGKDVVFDGESITFNRGIAKNPLTVTIYGSGAKGIANKMATVITRAFTEKLNSAHQLTLADENLSVAEAMFGIGNPLADEQLAAFQEALGSLLTLEAKESDGSIIMTKVLDSAPQIDLRSGKIDGATFRVLQGNLKTLFVGPLQTAINETMGTPLTYTVDAIRRAVQAQSIALQFAFRAAVDAKIAEKLANDPSYAKGDFLTREELNEIYDSLTPLAPIISTGAQNFFISKSESADLTSEFSRSLNGTMATPGFVEAPIDVGVKGIPAMVIGSGDGMMMQIFASMLGGAGRTLDVFDGLNMPVDMIVEYGRRVNEAVLQAWQANPLQGVADAFETFTKNYDPKTASKEERQLMIRALFPQDQWGNTLTAAQIGKRIEQLQDNLQALSRSMEARKKVLARVQLNVDQMAGANAPFHQAGEIKLEGLSDEEIVQTLNSEYERELAKLEKKAGLVATGNPAAEVIEFAEELASGAWVLSNGTLKAATQKLNGTKWQQQVLGDMLASPAAEGIQVITGSIAQLRVELAGRGISNNQLDGLFQQSEGTNLHGFTLPNQNLVVLVDADAETLVHEVIHALTYGKVDEYYAKGRDLGADRTVETEALRRIEALMEQFLTLDIGNEEADVRRAYHDARNAILDQRDSGNPAGALNEFMAWGLTNQKLGELQAKTKASPLAQLVRSAIDAIKQLIWGKGRKPAVVDDMLTNLRFNTAILTAAPIDVRRTYQQVVLEHRASPDSDPRLTAFEEAVSRKLVRFMKAPVTGPEELRNDQAMAAASAALAQSKQALLAAQKGFTFTDQQQTTFQLLVTSLKASVDLDPNALARLEELQQHVTKVLTVEDFMDNPNETDVDRLSVDRYYARQKYDVVLGNFGVEVDDQDRTSLLPVFAALAITQPEFRDILSRMQLPGKERSSAQGLDGWVENIGLDAMRKLGDMASGQSSNLPDVRAAVDALTMQIIQSATESKSAFGQAMAAVGAGIDAANRALVDGMQKGAEKLAAFGDRVKSNPDSSKATKTAGQLARVIAGIIDERTAAKVSEGLMASLDRQGYWAPFQELMSDLIGRTDDNAPVYDMIKPVRAHVQQRRQQFREELPIKIASEFSRKLTAEEWAQLHRALGKTDLAALRGSMTRDAILDLLASPAAWAAKIQDIAGQIQLAMPADWPTIERKSQQLATYMMTGVPGSNLLANAAAISNLLGETQSRNFAPSPQLEALVDQLVTMYALEQLSQADKDSVAQLAADERGGVGFAFSYLEGQRKDEQAKITGLARFNHYKGFMHEESDGEISLTVARDTQQAELAQKSWVRVENYGGSNLERGAANRGYYMVKVPARAAYKQGVLQTVQQTANGIDVATGMTHGRTVAGAITDPRAVDRAFRGRHHESASEPLIPRWNEQGQIMAYERSVDPQVMALLNTEQHLAKSLGIWHGRQVEELEAVKVNQILLQRLFAMWQSDASKGKAGRDRYVNLFDSAELKKDPVLADMMSTIPGATLAEIQKVFGEEFWVRRGMLNDAMGYREASVRNIWDGQTRWSKDFSEAVKVVVVGTFGNKAYEYAVRGEQMLQDFITDARVTIVVRSVVVPVANMMSNVYQLWGRGVPLAAISKGFRRKAAEIDFYMRTRKREIEAEAELRAVGADIFKARKLQSEIQSIQDSHRRLSIWPLLDVGEFTSISDGMLSADDIEMNRGGLTSFMERLVDKLPGHAKTIARYGIVGRDTALFKGLQRSVAYGDFLAKAVMFDHLTKTKGETLEKALITVGDEFVNYDRLPGRSRGYLESTGMLWFYNFKIRSTKVAVSMVRNNPLHLLLSLMAPRPELFGSVGSPVEDNVVSMAAEDSLHWSIGGDMATRAPFLNPWFNAVS